MVINVAFLIPEQLIVNRRLVPKDLRNFNGFAEWINLHLPGMISRILQSDIPIENFIFKILFPWKEIKFFRVTQGGIFKQLNKRQNKKFKIIKINIFL